MSDRTIIEDPRGRVVSVPSDKIPKGSRIIRPDVVPGMSENTRESNQSKEVSAPEEVGQTPENPDVAPPEDTNPEDEPKKQTHIKARRV